jgi:hypothetical protein
MNKIKAKAKANDFSPWEESFQDVFRTLEHQKHRTFKEKYETVEPMIKNRRFKVKDIDRRVLNRTSMNISKINLNSAEKQKEGEPQRESKRYAGPRISFYASMNPRITCRSKSLLDPEYELTQQHSAPKQSLTSRFIRD